MMMKPKETRVVRESMGKKVHLQYLEETCQGVKEECGTIYTHFMELAYWIRHQIQRCYDHGASVPEVRKILNKFK